MQQHYAAAFEQAVTFAKESLIKAETDMLEHTDRHDPIKFLRPVAIVLQAEVDSVHYPFFSRARVCNLKLSVGQRYAGDPRATKFGKVERKTAPTAADVEHATAGWYEKLRRKMTLLRKLGIIARLPGSLEIGAAVLPVGVEEQRVKLAVEVVMVRDIAPRSPARIELLSAAIEVSNDPAQSRAGR